MISGRWNEAGKEVLQVRPNLWVRVFLDQQRAGGVLDEKRKQPGSRCPLRYIMGAFIEARPACLDVERGLHRRGR